MLTNDVFLNDIQLKTIDNINSAETIHALDTNQYHLVVVSTNNPIPFSIAVWNMVANPRVSGIPIAKPNKITGI